MPQIFQSKNFYKHATSRFSPILANFDVSAQFSLFFLKVLERIFRKSFCIKKHGKFVLVKDNLMYNQMLVKENFFLVREKIF